MSREILFRGKSKVHGNWEYGCLIQSRGEYFIGNTVANDPENWSYTIPETVGQFTGLLDKNGVKIFEGDIICNDDYNTWEWRGVVKFSHGVFGAEWLTNIKSQSMVGSWGQKHNLRKLDDDILERQIIIGNIHDNPELIGKEVTND